MCSFLFFSFKTTDNHGFIVFVILYRVIEKYIFHCLVQILVPTVLFLASTQECQTLKILFTSSVLWKSTIQLIRKSEKVKSKCIILESLFKQPWTYKMFKYKKRLWSTKYGLIFHQAVEKNEIYMKSANKTLNNFYF